MHTLVLAAEDAALAVSLIGAVDSHPLNHHLGKRPGLH
jgi:hypothetical protein